MIAISARLAASRLHYAWVIIALTFVVIVVTAGVRATPGVLIVPFENEFHWSRATISFAIGVNLLVYGLVGPFAAAAMDGFGVRRTMALSLAVAAAGVALSPLMYNPLAARLAVGPGGWAVHRLCWRLSGSLHRRALVPSSAGDGCRPPDRGQCRLAS